MNNILIGKTYQGINCGRYLAIGFKKVSGITCVVCKELDRYGESLKGYIVLEPSCLLQETVIKQQEFFS